MPTPSYPNSIPVEYRALVKDGLDPILHQMWEELRSVESNVGTLIAGGFNSLNDRIKSLGVNVKDKGALGNGTTNDYQALVNAQNEAIAIGLPLYFPNGTYKISSNLILGGNNVAVIFSSGTMISPDSGVTITIAGYTYDGLSQRFSGNGTILITPGQPVRPEWWGAIGDGITNDTTAINKALTSVLAGGDVLLDGIYAVGVTGWTGLSVTSGSDLSIHGHGQNTGFKLLAAPSQNVQNNTTLFLALNSSNIHLSDFKIDLNNLEHSGIAFQNVTQGTIERLYITNSPSLIVGDNRSAIIIHSSRRISVLNNRIYRTSSGIQFGMSTGLGQITDSVLAGNIFQECYATIAMNATRTIISHNIWDTNGGGTYAIPALLEAVGVSPIAMTDFVIANNIFRNSAGVGLQIAATTARMTTDGLIQDNLFELNNEQGLLIFGGVSRLVIDGNLLRNNNKDGVGFTPAIEVSISASGALDHFSITNNTCYDSRTGTSKTQYYGIGLNISTGNQGLTGELIYDGLISGNTLYENKDSGLYLHKDANFNGQFARILIEGNRIYSNKDLAGIILAGQSGNKTFVEIEILNNVIVDNTGTGIRATLTSGDETEVRLINNCIDAVIFTSATPTHMFGNYTPALGSIGSNTLLGALAVTGNITGLAGAFTSLTVSAGVKLATGSGLVGVGGNFTAAHLLDVFRNGAPRVRVGELSNTGGESRFEMLKGASSTTVAVGTLAVTDTGIVKLLTRTDTKNAGDVSDPSYITAEGVETNRIIFNGSRSMTNNVAQNILSCTMAAGLVIGGMIRYTIEIFDGTDLQVETGEVFFSGYNKAGVFGNTITELNSQQNLSSGTLTTTWAITGANPAVISINVSSSLTPSGGYLRIGFSVENFTSQQVSTV